MAKIKIGKQYDESTSESYISTSGDSLTEITFDDLFDKSKRILLIDDRCNQNDLLREVEKLKIALEKRGDGYANTLLDIKHAETAIKNNNKKDMWIWLSKAGRKALDVSEQIGLDVLSGVLTHILTR